MAPILRFVAVAWTFFWRQPALGRAAFLLVFLPLLATGYLSAPMAGERPEQTAVLVVLHLAGVVLLTWGLACVLVVGKRLLQAKAGRLRTSFKAVQGRARGLVVALLLTDILRACVAALLGAPLIVLAIVAATMADARDMAFMAYVAAYPWIAVLALLLAVPPLLWLLQTTLAPMVVAYEKVAFRPALARSRQLTKGRLPYTLAVVAALGLLWAPGIAAQELLPLFGKPRVTLFVIPFVTAVLDTFAAVLWLLALTQYYKALGGKAKAGAGDEE